VAYRQEQGIWYVEGGVYSSFPLLPGLVLLIFPAIALVQGNYYGTIWLTFPLAILAGFLNVIAYALSEILFWKLKVQRRISEELNIDVKGLIAKGRAELRGRA
jgi:membrane protein implicated in regulation of membrane protease activity